MLEKTIERYLVDKVKKMNGMAVKLNSIGFAGLPDRMVLLPNSIIFFVETKAPGKKSRLLQLKIQSRLQALGFKVYEIDNKNQIKEVLKRYGEI